MLKGLGARILKTSVNYTNWGQIVVAFTRGDGKPRLPETRRYSFEQVYESFKRFEDSLVLFKKNLKQTREVYGLGAAQNFPILDYFAKGFDFPVILDDHPLRQDTFYPGLQYLIEKPEER